MAKQNLEDWDTNDSFDGDMDWDMDFDAMEPSKDRSAVTAFSAGAADAFTSRATDPKELGRIVRKSLPKEYEKPLEAIDAVNDNLQGLYRDVNKELRPVLNQAKKLGQGLLPVGKKFLPDGLYNKLEGLLKTEDRDVKLSQDPVEAAIQANIGSLQFMQAQAEEQAKKDEKQEVEKRVGDKIDLDRHRDLFGALDAIRVNTLKHVNYQESITLNYQRKSIELMTRMFFTGHYQLEETKRFNAVMDSKLNALVKNTGLPDFVKMRLSESYGELLRNKFIGNINDGLFGGSSNYVNKIASEMRKAGFGWVKERLSGIGDAMDMASMGADMLDSGMGMDAREMAGGVVGNAAFGKFESWLTKVLSKIIQNNPKAKGILRGGYKAKDFLRQLPYIIDNFDPYTDKLTFAHVRNALDVLTGADQKEGYRALNVESGTVIPGSKWIMDMVKNTHDNVMGQRNRLTVQGYDGLQQQSMFTNQVRRSITDVIPGFLKHMLRELQIIRTGDENIELMEFDFKSNKFLDRQSMRKVIYDELITQSDKTSAMSDADDLLKLIDPNNSLTPERRKVFRKQLLDMKINRQDVKTFMDSNNPDTRMLRLKLKSMMPNTLQGDVFRDKFTELLYKQQSWLSDPRGLVQDFYNMGYSDLLEEGNFIKDGKVNVDDLQRRRLYDDGTWGNTASGANGTAGNGLPTVGGSPWGGGDGGSPNPYGGPGAPLESQGIFAKFDQQAALLSEINENLRISTDGNEYQNKMLTHLGEINQKLTDGINLNGIIVTTGREGGRGILGGKRLMDITVMDMISALGSGVGAVSGFGKSLWNKTFGKLPSIVKDMYSKAKDIGGAMFDRALSYGSNFFDVHLPNRVDPVLTAAKLKLGDYYYTNDRGEEVTISSFRDLLKAGRHAKAIYSRSENRCVLDREEMVAAITQNEFLVKYKGKAKTLFGKAWTPIKKAYDYVDGNSKRAYQFMKRNTIGLAKKGYDFTKQWLVEGTDIYVGDEEQPRLRKSIFANGGYTSQSSGKVIRNFKDIDGPVLDSTGVVVLNSEDIQKGLFGPNKTPLRVGLGRLTGYISDKVGMLKKFSKDLFKGSWDRTKGYWVWGKGLLGEFFGKAGFITVTTGRTNKLLRDIRDMLNIRLPGDPQTFVDDDMHGTGGGFRVGSLAMLKRKRDRDGDGTPDVDDDEPGWGAKGKSWLSGLLGKGKGKLGGLLGALGLGGGKDADGLDDLLGEDEEGGGGSMLDNLLLMPWNPFSKERRERRKQKRIAKQRAKNIKKIRNAKVPKGKFGKLLQLAKVGLGALGIGAAGTAVAGTTGAGALGAAGTGAAATAGGATVAGGAAAAGGGAAAGGLLSTVGRGVAGLAKFAKPIPILGTALGALTMYSDISKGDYLSAYESGTTMVGAAIGSFFAPPLGTIIGAAIGWGFGKITGGVYKWLTKNNLPEPDSVRFMMYGFHPKKDKDKVSKVFGMEQIIAKYLVGNQNGMGLRLQLTEDEQREIMDLFGLGPNDTEALQAFGIWFSKRFIPVFTAHAKAAVIANKDKGLSGIDDLSAVEKYNYMNALKVPPGIMGFTINPFDKDDTLKVSSTKDIEEKIKTLKEDYKKNIKGDDANKVNDAKTKKELVEKEKQKLIDKDGNEQIKGHLSTFDKFKKQLYHDAGVDSDDWAITRYMKLGWNHMTGGTFSALVDILKKEILTVGANATGITPKIGLNGVVQAIDVIRYKTYGLTELEETKMDGMLKLEAEIMKSIEISPTGEALFSKKVSEFAQSYVGFFGINAETDKSRLRDWTEWFEKRFLPTFLTYLSAYYRLTGRKPTGAPHLLHKRLNGPEKVQMATAIYTTTTGPDKVPVWYISNSPWAGYRMNKDVKSIDNNLAALKKEPGAKAKISEQTTSNNSGIKPSVYDTPGPGKLAAANVGVAASVYDQVKKDMEDANVKINGGKSWYERTWEGMKANAASVMDNRYARAAMGATPLGAVANAWGAAKEFFGGGGNANAGTTVADAGDPQLMVYNAFIRAGLSDGQARAFTAEIGRENDYRKSLMFGTHVDPENHRVNGGMMSWQKERLPKLLNFMKSKGLLIANNQFVQSQASIDAQAEFIVQEIRQSYPKVAKDFLDKPGIDYNTAARVLGVDYIKWAFTNSKYQKHHQRRDKHYNTLNQKLGNAKPGVATPSMSVEDERRATMKGNRPGNALLNTGAAMGRASTNNNSASMTSSESERRKDMASTRAQAAAEKNSQWVHNQAPSTTKVLSAQQTGNKAADPVSPTDGGAYSTQATAGGVGVKMDPTFKFHPCPKYVRISSPFGMRFHPVLRVYKGHNGTDYAAPVGTPLYAMGDGVISSAGMAGANGIKVAIDHGNGYRVVYCHLSRLGKFRAGSMVKAGACIGYVGNTGRSTGPHLHLSIYKNKQAIDPETICRGLRGRAPDEATANAGSPGQAAPAGMTYADNTQSGDGGVPGLGVTKPRVVKSSSAGALERMGKKIDPSTGKVVDDPAAVANQKQVTDQELEALAKTTGKSPEELRKELNLDNLNKVNANEAKKVVDTVNRTVKKGNSVTDSAMRLMGVKPSSVEESRQRALQNEAASKPEHVFLKSIDTNVATMVGVLKSIEGKFDKLINKPKEAAPVEAPKPVTQAVSSNQAASQKDAVVKFNKADFSKA